MGESALQLGRRFALVFLPLALTVCAGSSGKSGAEAASSAPRCNATTVHYKPYKGVQNGLAPIPWVAASPTSAGLVGHLFYYDAANAWKQKQVVRLHIYAGGEDPPGRISMKILWELRHGSASTLLRIRGRRLDGAGVFSQRQQPASATQFPSIVKVPEPGCWRLTLTAGKIVGAVTVIAVPGKSS
jgi:hypothetical protein